MNKKYLSVIKYFLFIFIVFCISTSISYASEVGDIQNIEIEGGNLSPSFKEDQYEYYIHLKEGTTEINVLSSASESVSVIGEGKRTVTDNEEFFLIGMSKTGTCTLYKFHVSIDSITVDNISLDGIDFSFDPYVYNYEMETSYNTKTVNVNITTKPGQSYTVDGSTHLRVGTNTINVNVSETGKKNQTYTFKIKRREAWQEKFSYLGESQEYEIPEDGYYRIDLWGAQGGGKIGDKIGGYGGYTAGDIFLSKGTKLYIYIGGIGQAGSVSGAGGGYNGGGNAQIWKSSDPTRFGGGGATDIRLVSGNWNDFNSLKSRIMVAAGGGGASPYTAGGKYAGGLIGYDGGDNRSGYGGTQIAGGLGQSSDSSYGRGYPGGFGYGGLGVSHAAGGGAGYYGGGGGVRASVIDGNGGGGSSFISGHNGCNAIDESSTSSSLIHTGQSVHYSGKYFINTMMIDGAGYQWTTEKKEQINMPSKDNPNKRVVGNEDSGAARITYLGLEQSTSVESGLESLTVTGGTLNQEFDKDTFEYTLTLDEDNTDITIDAIPRDLDATILGLGSFQVPSLENQYQVTVISSNGELRIYTITTSREKSNNPNLEDIKINGISLENFEPTRQEYTVNVPFNTTFINLEGIKKYPETEVSYPDGEKVELRENEQKVRVLSVSEDKSRNILYTITIHRESSTKLKSLVLTGLVDNLPFSPLRTSYDSVVNITTFEVPVTAIPYDKDATVTMEGNDYIPENGGTVKITVSKDGLESTVYEVHITKFKNSTTFEETYEYTGDYQEFIAPVNGFYKVELWGAQGGGKVRNKIGGYGGYTAGDIFLSEGTKLYIYIGGAGTVGTISGAGGGYNGGGNAQIYQSNVLTRFGGGGATDIRLVAGNWDNFNSLKSRIMVAAGGGGTSEYTDGGKYAGGLIGYDGGDIRSGYGGTQTTGGIGRNSNSSSYGTGYPGGFGYGGLGVSHAAGGGAGYYGGGGGVRASQIDGQGGGGSSFISGHNGCDAIASESTSEAIVHTGSSTHYSGYTFSNTVMIDGAGYQWTTVQGKQRAMPNPTTGGTYPVGTGNTGDGKAKISLTEPKSADNYLDSLTTSKGTLSPEFKTSVLDYTLELPSDSYTIDVLATLKDERATLTGTGTIRVPSGNSTHEVVVTAEDGSIRVYTIHLYRPKSSDPTAENIKITGMEEKFCSAYEDYCSYTYDQDQTYYRIIIPYEIRNLEVIPELKSDEQGLVFQTATDDNTTIVPDGKVEFTGNKFIMQVEVTSEDESAVNVYTFEFVRDEAGNNNLKSLKLTNPMKELENFSPYTYQYYVTVPNEYENVEVEAIPEIEGAKVEITGNTNLKVGINQVIVSVTSMRGEKKVYLITVNRELSENVFLSSLIVKNNSNNQVLEYTPEFNKIITDYQIEVENNVTEVNIEATTEDNTAVITGDGVHMLKSGTNILPITVTNNGVEEVYNVTINRKKNSNAYLQSITINNYTYTPEFDKNTFEYYVEIPSDIMSLDVKVVPEEPTTTAKIRGNTGLIKKEHIITITATAEDMSYLVYKIYVTKPISHNNYLKSLTTSVGTLEPGFDKEILEYKLTVDADVSSIDLKGVPEDNKSSVRWNGKYSLAPGINNLELTVTSEAGENRVYKIEVKRLKDDDVTLKEVRNNQNTTVTKVEDDTLPYNYLMNVQYEINQIEITGIPNATTSTVTGNGNYNLNIGNNDVTLSVTSEEGTVKDYVVRIVRDLSTNDDLSFLYVEEGGLSPNFNETTIYYNVKIPYEKNSVHIEAIPEDKDAHVEIKGDRTNLEVGVVREIEVIVTAPKGNQKTYKLVITRQEATTENLALEELLTNRGELNPPFDPDTLNYTLEVENEIKDITISATSMSEDVQVVGTGNYNLRVGKNGISVFVIGTDGVQRDYQIVVIRKKSKDATLSSLVVKGHTLSPKFNKTTENYTLKTSGTSLDFTTIQPTEKEATYVVSGNENFVTGENIVTIEVTAPDKTTRKTYTLTVTKEGSKNNNLASLEVVGYSILPKFHKAVTFYSVNVDNNLNSVVVKATAEDSNSTITGTGLHTIYSGENYIEVEVTSQEGKTKTYTILITKDASDNNYLSSLTASHGTWDKEFDKTVNEYQIEVPYEVDEIDIDALKEDASAFLSYDEHYNLNVGENTIVISVTSESGKVNTYKLIINRAPVISAYLKDLTVKDYELDTEFDKELFEYYITVGNEVTELELSYTKEDKNATVEVTGNENFEVGMNEIHIKVTSSDGSLEEEYILYVNREFSTNNYLSILTVNRGTLDPVFDRDTLIYNVEVEKEIETITVSGVAEDKNATITSGLGEHNLSLGNNVIQVKVRSSIGITRTYKINVLRKQSSNNYLSSLIVTGNGKELVLTPSFDKQTNEYSGTLDSDMDNILVNATAEDESAIVIGNGEKTVKTGLNQYEITVTSEDGNVNTYILNITKAVSSNNYLSSLVPSVGTLDPIFNKGTLEYILELEKEDTTLGFTATPESNLAKVTGIDLQTVSDGESIRNIVVTAENGDTRTYKIKVKKESESEIRLESLEVFGYPFTFDPDTFEYNLQVSKSKKKLLESEITAIPKDPNATVNLMGDVELIDESISTYIIEVIAKDGYTTQEYKIHITRDSLEHTIRSDIYTIDRNETKDYVIGMDPKTKKLDFIGNFLNDRETLHIYGSDGVEITDSEALIGSYMVIKLEIDGITYDELVITVRGDLNGDGLVTAADNIQAKNYVLGKKQINFLVTKIVDINQDGLVTAPDIIRIKNYILGKRGLNE